MFNPQMIADAGYQGEIVKVATASTYIGVFNDVLKDSLERLLQEDDVGLDENLPDLIVSNWSVNANVTFLKFLDAKGHL
jgi:negative elongation factor C/D